MASTPIRQPRGPSSNSFGGPSPAPSPPAPDTESTLRRNNTIGSTRHQASASVSGAASGAFHGTAAARENSRFRSGSLSSGEGLVRRQSGREVRTQEVVQEVGEEPGEADGGWAKGLSRQSSLPSRKIGMHQRRAEQASHVPSQSLSGLTMLSGDGMGAGVSRTQSLRAQAHKSVGGGAHTESGLGRSSSLRGAGDHHYPRSPPTQPTTPRNPFTPPTPPPVSSTAALPPFTLPEGGADVKRHQSLGNNYGRAMRDRLDKPAALLSMDQREQLRVTSPPQHEEPPTSPIGRSVWAMSMAPPSDDGWNRQAAQLAGAFEQMQVGQAGARIERPRSAKTSMPPPPLPLAQPQPQVQLHPDEPSWVAGLVGPGPDRASPSPRGYPPALQNPYLQAFPQYNIKTPQFQSWSYPTPPGTAVPMQANDRDVIELARQKGLNPASFDTRPPQARFFVIKSYTEDDVQKSLKHEIWSSTVLGNKRLDAAFRESAHLMPIYLFFSVNGSKHFCGVAQMLTPVDESQTSNVWAQDKWKGTFRVKWIFVRDVPSHVFRHILLINTPERKPMTNSRDTQELHYEAGCECLQIFLEHQTKSKTSLLQDFAYYEQLSNTRSMPQTAPLSLPAGMMAPPPLPSNLMGPPPLPMYAPSVPGTNGVPPVPPIPVRFR